MEFQTARILWIGAFHSCSEKLINVYYLERSIFSQKSTLFFNQLIFVRSVSLSACNYDNTIELHQEATSDKAKHSIHLTHNFSCFNRQPFTFISLGNLPVFAAATQRQNIQVRRPELKFSSPVLDY